jgi:hypothetical protein
MRKSIRSFSKLFSRFFFFSLLLLFFILFLFFSFFNFVCCIIKKKKSSYMWLWQTHTSALKPVKKNTKDQPGKSPIFFLFSLSLLVRSLPKIAIHKIMQLYVCWPWKLHCVTSKANCSLSIPSKCVSQSISNWTVQVYMYMFDVTIVSITILLHFIDLNIDIWTSSKSNYLVEMRKKQYWLTSFRRAFDKKMTCFDMLFKLCDCNCISKNLTKKK